MKEYATKDIANIVGIAPVTVRKYAQVLEQKSYTFTRDDRSHRIFTDKDIKIFSKMKELSNDTGMNIESIAEQLVKEQSNDTQETIQSESYVSTLKQKEVEISDMLQSDERYDNLLKEMKEMKELILMQQKYIDQRLEDRDKKMMESIRQLQEVKNTLLETSVTEQPKQKKWYEFWK